MQFEFSPKVQELQKRLSAFMDEHIYPNEPRYHQHTLGPDRWQPVPVIEELKPKAHAAGLWNLFLPESDRGAGLTNLEYAPLCEIMGRSTMASEVFNCSSPDTGHLAGQAEILFETVRVPSANLLLGEGRGFEIAQGRLGPGRIHHCMRLIGVAERALEGMCRRAQSRVAFGKTLAEQGTIRADIADSRIEIEQARLLVLKAAYMMDTVGNKAARAEIAMIKVAAPNMACRVIDWAIQAHGAAGLSDDFVLASSYVHARKLRLADGPDEVHRGQIGQLEFKRHL